jgi:hypothetical protein
MADLILEFGCASCYLQDLDCGGNCIFPLNASLNRKKLNKTQYSIKNSDGSFTIKKEFFSLDKQVPDVYRYDLKSKGGQWKLFEPNNIRLANKWISKTSTNNKYNTISKDKQKNNILIILESPHNDEYEYQPTFKPLQPANGSTGRYFFTYFIKDILSDKKSMLTPLKKHLKRRITYRICFVNPVPFQTSLHYILNSGKKGKIGIDKDIRNAVWNKLFTHCKSDFIRRVESYKPFMILNSCTGGKEGLKNHNALKFKVKDAIGNNCATYQFNTAHPSSWKTKRNRYCNKW